MFNTFCANYDAVVQQADITVQDRFTALGIESGRAGILSRMPQGLYSRSHALSNRIHAMLAGSAGHLGVLISTQ